MEALGGIRKIIQKGSAQPGAVRFHVPQQSGGWSQVTWGELHQRAEQIALWLDEQGIRRDRKVSVYATTRVEWGYVVPAIEACRGVFVPVYFSNTPSQTHYVVDHSDAEILFTERALLGKVIAHWDEYRKLRRVVVWDLDGEDDLAALLDEMDPGLRQGRCASDLRAKLISLAEVYARGAALRAEWPERLQELVATIHEDDVAAIIYTSGTTGVPKGVVLSNKNIAATGESWTQVLEHAFPPAGERRDILWLPVSHMSGWGILCQGTTLDYETWISDPYQLLQILPEVKPTMLFSVPAYWEKLYTLATSASPEVTAQHARLRELTGGCLSFLLSGGAGLKREVKEFFQQAGIQMIEGYGLTECSPNLAMNTLDDYDFDSVGKPMPGVSLKLAPDGEICAKGDNVFAGYYKMPAETAACFDEQGWFYTGDLGEWTARGFLKIRGRKKEIIATSGGKKIGPAGIEGKFVGDTLIEHVVLYGDERKYLTALITLNEAAVSELASAGELRPLSYQDMVASEAVRGRVQTQIDAVNAELAPYETIKSFFLYPGHLSVEAGHLTPSLKLRRAKVWQDFAPQLDALYQRP